MTGVALIVAGLVLAVWSVTRDVGYGPGVIVGVVLLVAGWYRLVITGPQRAADRRRRGRGGYL